MECGVQSVIMAGTHRMPMLYVDNWAISHLVSIIYNCTTVQSLLHAGATPRYGAFYGESSRPTLVADFSCSGTEQELLSCSRNVLGVAHCRSYEEAGVTCLGIYCTTMLKICIPLFALIRSGSFPVTLSKRVGTLFGGDCVLVSGMALHEDDEILCKFGKTAVDRGLYINENQAMCVTPPAREESFVEFTMEVRRGLVNLTGGALYQYSKGNKLWR